MGLLHMNTVLLETIGGYDEAMKFAEDVKFHVDLWRIGRKRGARLVRAGKAKSIFSAVRRLALFPDNGESAVVPFESARGRCSGGALLVRARSVKLTATETQQNASQSIEAIA